jgi:DNA polymerase delta subunit 1
MCLWFADSVLAILNPPEPTRMESHFALAEELSKIISKEFRPPHDLEFEKAYSPYLLFKKKRYAGMMYTNPIKPDKLDIKGLQLVRRDSCPFVRQVSEEILNCIMKTKDKDQAWLIAKEYVLRLLRAQEPMESFVVSKTLKSTYKNPESQPHHQVALKIGQRRDYPVPSNERVAFIIVEDKDNPDGLIATRAEDPDYAKEHHMVMDRLHYLDSQMNGPLETLLNILDPTFMKQLYNDEDIAPLLEELRHVKKKWTTEAKRIRTNVANRQREISSFFFTVPKKN